jgi:hypothetical protein
MIRVAIAFGASVISSVTGSGQIGVTVSFPRIEVPVNTFCEKVDDCLGISDSGSDVKFLNEKGEWVEISSGGGTWGGITGTLSNQIDLQAALDDKFDSPSGIAAQYIRGDGSVATFPTALSSFTNDSGFITGNQNIAISGDASGSGITAITLTLATVNSNTGTFNNLTVNAKGLVTSASNVSYITSAITSLNGLTGATQTFTNDTNVTILSSGTAHAITWAGTLADGRIASAATWNAKQNAITTGTTSQYLRGDLSLATFPTNVSSFSNDAGYVTASSVNTFTNKSGNISQWTNDSGFITLSSTLSGLSITGSTISSADSIITAFGALQNQINGILGGATYQGIWNATTNSPSLSDGTGVKGHYYVVSVAGTQNLGSGAISFDIGDWAIHNGTIYQKVDNTDAVSSVNGAIGAVVITTTGTTNRISISGATGLTPTIDISSSYVGQASITTLGTITTGVWNGTAIANANLANSSITVNGTSISLGASGTVTAAAGTLTGTTLNSSVVSSSLTSVGTIATGVWNGTTIAIANGGTGQTTATAAFDALAPSQTSNSGKYLTTNGTTVSWATVTSGVNALSAIGSSPNANAATISGTTLNLEPASTSFGGIITTGTQSITGQKTIVGTGASSATSSFIVINSTPATLFTVRNDGRVYVGSPSTAALAVSTSNAFLASVPNSASNNVVAIFENQRSISSTTGAIIQLLQNGSAAMTSGDRLGVISFGGGTSASAISDTASGIFSFATENWSVTKNGSDLRFRTSAIGGTSNSEVWRIHSNGNFSNTGAIGTAQIELKAGTATANTAPVKLTSGTLETTARAGLIEYNDNFFFTKVNNVRFSMGGIIFDHYADTGNTSTTETDLYSDSITAGTLSSNGGAITGFYSGIIVSSGTATRQLRVYFGGTLIYDSAAVTFASAADWMISFNVVRESSTVVRCSVTANTTSASTAPYSQYTRITGLTLSNANTLKITGTAAGVGAATNDIVAKVGKIYFDAAAVT